MKTLNEIRRENLLTLIEQAGSIRKLAEKADISESYISQLKNNLKDSEGKERNIGTRIVRKLTEAFRLPENWFNTDHSVNKPFGEPITFEETLPLVQPRAIPIIGYVQGGSDGYYEEVGGDDWIMYHTSDPAAYVLRVRGESMLPRIKPGECIVIEPNTPIMNGDNVLVCTKDGEKMVKEFLYERDGIVFLDSINEAFEKRSIKKTDILQMECVSAIISRPRYR